MRYSVQPKDSVQGYGFLSFVKNMGIELGKNISKNVLIMLNNLLQMHLKLLQKEEFKK